MSCPFTQRLRANAVCIDMHSAADVIDAQDKVRKEDEALLKRALRTLEVYEAQTRPIWEAQEVMQALRHRLEPVGPQAI